MSYDDAIKRAARMGKFKPSSFARKKDVKRTKRVGMSTISTSLGDPAVDSINKQASRLEKDFGYKPNEAFNEANRTYRRKRADAGRPVSPVDIRTKQQKDKFITTGLREANADQAAKQAAVQAVIAKSNVDFIKSQIEGHTGKSSKTMAGFGLASNLVRGVPALVAASIMKPKSAAPATPTPSDIKEQKRTVKRIYSQITKK